MATYRHDPDERLDYWQDWSGLGGTGALPGPDTIVAATWTCNSPDVQLTPLTSRHADNLAGVWVEPDAPVGKYTLTCHVSTSQGREAEAVDTLEVREK